jgi:hypothetical protein
MSRRVAWIVIAGVLTSILFASVATSGGVNLWTAPQWEATPQELSRNEIGSSSNDAAFEPSPDPDGREPIEFPDWIEAIFRVVFVTAAIAAAVALIIAAWRRRPRLRWRRLGSQDDFEVLPDVAAAIVEQAAAQRNALRAGAPRNAIVQCWLQLERDVAAVGLTRSPADTSLEFTERVLARYSVDSAAINELSALYREARFSEHSFDESARRAALDALERLHQALIDSTSDTGGPAIGASS